MDTKQQIADRIKKANNILVTVSANPSVDQLAACIGLTLVCNKLGKHATAVFSGAVPSVIEFLQPEKTIEKNTDSLRDFIISLDKSKADKLRYKVEDKVVKIFITPYKTSISDKDLDFSQGDFNVDVILALGVHNQADLDQAIIAHGRILHDAAVVTLNVAPGGELGGTNWLDPGASSLSELAAELSQTIDSKLMDSQIATAFLTGIVAETKRFSNAKTSPQTMSVSAELMSLGANQQLVASKLEEPAPRPSTPVAGPLATQPAATPAPPKADDGTLEIQHVDEKPKASEPEESKTPPAPSTPQIHIDDEGEIRAPGSAPAPTAAPVSSISPNPTTPTIQHTEGPKLILEPPTFASELTANANSEDDEEQPSGNPLTLPSVEAQSTPLLNRTMLKPQEPVAPSVGKTIEPPAAEQSGGGLPAPASPEVAPPATVMPQITPLTPPPSTGIFGPAEPTPEVPASVSTPTPSTPTSVSPDLVSPTPPATPMVSPSLPSPVAAASTPSPLNPFAPPVQSAPTPTPTPWQPPVSPVATTPAPVLPSPVEVAPPATAEETPQQPSVASARDAVAEAINANAAAAPLEPIKALNAQDFGSGSLHDDAQTPATDTASATSSVTPPPVPPPMMPLQ